MRLMRWSFGGGGPPSRRGGDPGPERERDCRRFEKAILLSISGDLPGRASRSLERHLKLCEACRGVLARASRLRERCLEVASERRTSIPSLWAEISSILERAPAPVLELPPLGWEGSGRRRTALLAAALSLAAGIVLACLLAPVLLEKLSGPEPASRTVLDSRWSQEWDEFVSGSEPRGDINIDPFSPEIPNPEVIDF